MPMEPAVALEDPALCAVRLGRGERVPARLAALLNPVDAATFHVYRLPARTPVELHYHDIDEYWMFLEGHPRVTLRGPQGRRVEVDLEPGDMVACLRGVEHTLWADHELVYYQFTSVAQGHERPGHLVRTVGPQ
jgi:mannose-6-phosphate isomerase-like protein (cupin superfamily)